jgi:hypothetical protein
VKSVAHILHLSLGSKGTLGRAVELARKHIMEECPNVKHIRVELLHDPEASVSRETAYRDNKFKWFQQIHGEDGRRMTVMNSARDPLVDPPGADLAETSTLTVRQANLVLLSGGEEEVEVMRRPMNLAIGNRLALAQALRALDSVMPPSSMRRRTPVAAVMELIKGLEKLDILLAQVDAEEVSSADAALRYLSEQFDTPEFLTERWSKAVNEVVDSEIEHRGQKISNMIVTAMFAPVSLQFVIPKTPIASLRGYETFILPIASYTETSTGRKVYFLETDQDDLVMFAIPAGDVSSGADIFAEVDLWLKSAKATSAGTTAVAFLQIPAFKVEHVRHSDSFAGVRTNRGTATRLVEISSITARLSQGLPLGMLKTEVGKGEVACIVEDFIFGLWHGALDELDVPLFVTLVDSTTWIRSSSSNLAVEQ